MSGSRSQTKVLNAAKTSLPVPNYGSFNQSGVKINTSTPRKDGPSRKCYGSKRQRRSYTTRESFGLPDENICTNSPVFLGMDTSALDTDKGKPQDFTICTNITDYSYWENDSLQPFEDEIRDKIKPDNIKLAEDKELDIISDSVLEKTNLALKIDSLPNKNKNTYSKLPIEKFQIMDSTGSQTQISLNDNDESTHSSLPNIYSDMEHNNTFPECLKEKSSISSELVGEETCYSFQRQLRPRNNLSYPKKRQTYNSLEFSFPEKVEIKLESDAAEDSADTKANGALAILNRASDSVSEDVESSRMSTSSSIRPISPNDDLDVIPLSIRFSIDPKPSDVSVSFEPCNTSTTEEPQIKMEKKIYSIGDLVWAKLNRYPYWPAVICKEPDTDAFVKDGTKKNSKPHKLYHVRFFGDSGRRCWIKEGVIMLYNSKNDLEMIVKKLESESQRHFIIKDYLIQGTPKIMNQWKNAVEEIESHRHKSFEEILQFLLNSMPSPRKRKLSEIMAGCEINLDGIIEKRYKKMSSSDKEDPKDSEKDISVQEPSTSAAYKTPKPAKVEENIFIDDATDPNVYTYEYQLSLHKKNALFNGLTRVKVCDFCFKTGNIFKCKGRCGGRYHFDCAAKVTQPRYRATPENQKKNNSAELLSTSSNNQDSPQTRSRTRCQVSAVQSTPDTNVPLDNPVEASLPENDLSINLEKQIDSNMQNVMKQIDSNTYYWDSSEESSEENSSDESDISGTLPDIALKDNTNSEETNSDNSTEPKKIEHVTADVVEYTNIDQVTANMKCTYCLLAKDPPCYVCGSEMTDKGETVRQKCCQSRCYLYYHDSCLNNWPQTLWPGVKWSKSKQPEDLFCCPVHTCHTCYAEELGNVGSPSPYPRVPMDKLARCLLCPAAFHTSIYCIPAGSEVLGGSQIICPRHREPPIEPINTYWCFICSKGGNLVCCETCPTSVHHTDCQPIIYTHDGRYICEDCESGRFPLYDEIVWVKLHQFRWWPATIIFPNEIPQNLSKKLHRGDFVVRFFGTNKYYPMNKARAFLFAEGDAAGSCRETTSSKNKVNEYYEKAIEDATTAYMLKQDFKVRREAELIRTDKPPTYCKINKNKRVGNARDPELDLSNSTPCDCDPSKPHPCGPDSNCINRHLLTECNPRMCQAGVKCENKSFQRREYPSMVPFKTRGLGWGLKTLEPIKKGQFVIEYVGEIISTEEYQRRMKNMVEKKEENYYFMFLDADSMIDAGPKGNLSRFMNHCCDPNCITQKWTVNGETRVGLFAKCDIESEAELTFNYNWVAQDKKVCKCGASSCTGFIGVKNKQENITAISTEPRKYRKSSKKPDSLPVPPCFKCGELNSDITCNNKTCSKGYHLNCLNSTLTDASKFTCPRHYCNICSHRAARCCEKCTNSFCSSHSEGNIRYDRLLKFLCKLHDLGESSTDTLSSKILKEIPKQAPSEPDNLKIIDKETIRSAREQQRIQRLMTDPEKLLTKTAKNKLTQHEKSLNEEEQDTLCLKYRLFSRRHLKRKAQSLSNVPGTSVPPNSAVDKISESKTFKPVRARKSKLDSTNEKPIVSSSSSDEDAVNSSLVINNKDKENLCMDDDDEISLEYRLAKKLSNKKN
ncbi:unnamed protein product [Ceutorhynchus assimilis]|uniref:Histone-lysine N-methyltransferase n=1 Tax=Ceutorhynchus assimilis TaxID=467358 RepID=A0A9N9MA56_9CUCU|nr:unnamed protein product [Ceutorhynchus assimilis]